MATDMKTRLARLRARRTPHPEDAWKWRKGADMEKAAEDQGFYRGHKTSLDTVKSKTDFQGIPVHIDRPKGFVMEGKGKDGPWKRQYRYDYGFIPKTDGGDGDGLDVFLGPDKTSKNAYWAIQHRDDGSFDEYKVMLGFNSRGEAKEAYCQHIPKRMLKGLVTIRIEMMKAMLGLSVGGFKKTAGPTILGFLDELESIGGVSL